MTGRRWREGCLGISTQTGDTATCSVHATTIMWKTVIKKTVIDTVTVTYDHKEGKPQKVIVERAGCSQSVASKHTHGTLPGSEKCGLSSKVDPRTWWCFEWSGARLEPVHQKPPHTDVFRENCSTELLLLNYWIPSIKPHQSSDHNKMQYLI